MKRFTVLGAEEFDFRSIPPHEVPVALAWETARTHPLAREILSGCLDSKVTRRYPSVREMLNAWKEAEDSESRRVTQSGGGYQRRLHAGFERLLGLARQVLTYRLAKAALSMFDPLGAFLLQRMWPLAMDNPDFPAPWLARRNRHYEWQRARNAVEIGGFTDRVLGYLTNHNLPRTPEEFKKMCQEGKDPFANLLQEDLTNKVTVDLGQLRADDEWFALRVDFETCGKKEIMAELEAWVDARVKTHKRGRNSHVAYGKLKRLGAYRIHQAGMSYTVAEAFISAYDDPRNPALVGRTKELGIRPMPRRIPPLDPDEGSSQLPLYQDDAGWSDAISRAKEDLDAFGHDPGL